MIGGGRVFGPKPHDYVVKLNKKVRQLARKSALSAKATAGVITVVEDLQFAAPKTKDFVSVMKGLLGAVMGPEVALAYQILCTHQEVFV